MTFDLGKWHPELGDFETWKERKLIDFQQRYVLRDEQAYRLYTGGIALFAEGYEKPQAAGPTDHEIEEGEEDMPFCCDECLYWDAQGVKL